MWICLNNAFFSIVDKGVAPENLLVRARRPGDIEKVFPGAVVTSPRGTDYQCRAEISRVDIANALAAEVMSIDYNNFKNSVKDHPLHDAYGSFWHQHARLQPRRPYS